MFQCLYSCCLPQIMKEISQDSDEDWSSTIRLYKNRNLSKECPQSNDLTPITSESNIYILPTVEINKDFSDLFQLAYQKCLYGPLTSIPRPLKSHM